MPTTYENLIPRGVAAEVVQRVADAQSALMQLAHKVPMPSGVEQVPVISSAPVSGFVSPAYGGLKPGSAVDWTAETLTAGEIGGLATRTLYSDFDETLFEAKRPLTINGIAEIALNGDLLDRSLILYLPRIANRRRRQEEAFWATFRPQRGRLLGALLDAVVVGLQRSREVELSELPRMADFAHWVSACEPALGWPSQTFLAAYDVNRGSAVALSLEASLVSEPVKRVAALGFEGTATDLLAQIGDYVSEETRRKKAWPKSASALGGQLRRLAPNLRSIGLTVEFGRTRQRLIRLGLESAVDAVASVDVDGVDGDDGDLQARSKSLPSEVAAGDGYVHGAPAGDEEETGDTAPAPRSEGQRELL